MSGDENGDLRVREQPYEIIVGPWALPEWKSTGAANTRASCASRPGRWPSPGADSAVPPTRVGGGVRPSVPRVTLGGVDFPWRVKQRQADEHLRRFADACAAYVRTEHVGFGYETDAAAGTIRVRLQADADPPLSLGATIGDVLHNLRSALDAVAWEACQVGPLTEVQEGNVYFPIVLQAKNWGSAKGSLPNVSKAHFDVFRQLQPWYWDEEARKVGVDVVPRTERHPLVRLDRMAKDDRHRLPHLVVTRAGDTWLGTPEGVEVEVKLSKGYTGGARPGDVVAEWRIEPLGEAASVNPRGRRHPGAERRGHVLQAVGARRTAEDAAGRHPGDAAHGDRRARRRHGGRPGRARPVEPGPSGGRRRALRSLVESAHVIDGDYMEQFERARGAEEATRTAALDCWRELFD
jgi:hypothetical protein